VFSDTAIQNVAIVLDKLIDARSSGSDLTVPDLLAQNIANLFFLQAEFIAPGSEKVVGTFHSLCPFCIMLNSH
jgi:hypothetical protein